MDLMYEGRTKKSMIQFIFRIEHDQLFFISFTACQLEIYRMIGGKLSEDT